MVIISNTFVDLEEFLAQNGIYKSDWNKLFPSHARTNGSMTRERDFSSNRGILPVVNVFSDAWIGANIDGSIVEVTWAKPADKSESVKSQSTRNSRQLMDWSLNGDLANPGNYFLDPTTALLAGLNPLMLSGSG